ncbi:MAG: thymidine phosphorylase, partial [Hyphomicrobiales bacterium]|nr:thymidine phosphorylase [Hyphomicrobiales bacterium]
MMLAQEIIRRKRDGHVLTGAEITFLIESLTNGSLSEGQAAAFAMAVFFQGMVRDEIVALTGAMTRSGTVLDWRSLNLAGPVLDKHSTGGIGDNVSLILAPLVAACGGFVPMIAGRGLGHTGGTLDKLDSIPGYTSTPDLARFRASVQRVGCAIIGQTADLAPADKRLYAIRDITATVESLPLITASILSKKLAAGLEGLVMDVKTGSGAFMAQLPQARELAQSIVAVANAAQLPTVAVITDMNEPLASAAGNALEVKNAVDFLTKAHRDPRLETVVLALGVQMLRLGGLAASSADAEAKLTAALNNGAACERFARMVAALGGPVDFVENFENYLPKAAIVQAVPALQSGTILSIDTRAIGVGVIGLGGGRKIASDTIDAAVGYAHIQGLGQTVSLGQPLAFVHARTPASAAAATHILQQAMHIGDSHLAPIEPVNET